MKTIPKTFVRTPYNYDLKAASVATGLNCPEPTLAKQEFKDDADINNIMYKFGVTGELPQVPGSAYGDFSSTMSYHDMQNTIIAAQNAFKTLPASVRATFDNDPANVIDFLNDPANRDKAIELGLVDGKITAKTAEISPEGENPQPSHD
jgi:phage internal scaffolding protein